MVPTFSKVSIQGRASPCIWISNGKCNRDWWLNTATLESQWHNWAYSWVGSEWIRTTLILKKVLKDPGSAGIYQIPNPPSNYFAEQLCVFALQSTESLFALVLPWSSIASKPRKPLVFFRKNDVTDVENLRSNPGTGIACDKVWECIMTLTW